MINLSKVPDADLWSEINRRRGGLRASYTGGLVWAEHNETTSRCRCVTCNKVRAAKLKAKVKAKGKAK